MHITGTVCPFFFLDNKNFKQKLKHPIFEIKYNVKKKHHLTLNV